MIGRRGKWMIILYMAFLTVLFLMCSTDLIIREPEKEVYQIAVIIEDARDDNYGSFRKGMDQAAMELNADVHFITLYEKMDADQQMDLISREQQDGADALIIVPADADKVAGALTDGRVTVPAVIIGSEITGEKAAGTIGADYKNMGRQLAEAVMRDADETCQVLILEEPQKRSIMSRLFLEGIKEEFEECGRGWKSAAGQETSQGFWNLAKILDSGGGQRLVILAETPELLTEAAGFLAENPEALAAAEEKKPGEPQPEALPEEKESRMRDGIGEGGFESRGAVLGLYGRGSTLPALNYLDRGMIQGICVTDEYSIGYLSVDMAVRALEGDSSRNRLQTDSYYIEKEDLRKPEYEKLLFPVE